MKISAYYSNQEMADTMTFYWKCFYCETSLHGKIS